MKGVEREKKMRAVIFANGVINQWPLALELSMESDLLIAADGGLDHCMNLNLTPHVIVGDLDSVRPKDLLTFEQKGVEILRFPKRKDETDLALAIGEALDRKIYEIVILGGLGKRWDMSFSNVLILASPMLKHASVKLLEGRQEIFSLHEGQSVEIKGLPGDTVSLLPLAQDAGGVTLSGFEYRLDSETLPVGTTRGVSNVLRDPPARICIQTGNLLVVVSRNV